MSAAAPAGASGSLPAAELAALAAQVLPAEVYAYYAGGSGTGQSVSEQVAAWQAVRLRPRVLTDVSTVDTTVELLGQQFASPVLVAPTALHGLAHADGEVATARGARRAGCGYVVSMRASRRLHEIADVAGPFWQQIYVLGDRGVSDEVARQAAALGAGALVLTVDTPLVAPKAAGIPRSLPPTGLLPVLDGRDPADPRYQQAADVTARDIERLHELSGLPVVAKGVLRGDQAAKCCDAGAAAVIVSTHGGRQLDGVVPVPYALPEVVDAVGDRAEVYADGGLRTGVDVLRALGLGARAVLSGRPSLWALAIGGADAVTAQLTAITDELRVALALAGCVSPSDVGPDIASLA